MTDQETLKYYRMYDPPPADFDPLQAEDRLLRVHGFPRRPDAVKEPRLRELWDKAFSTKLSIVKAELAVNHELTKRKRTSIGKKGDDGDFGPLGWGGVVVLAPSMGEPITVIVGEWVVPDLVPIKNEPQQANLIGVWVGLDGYSTDNSEILQAGIAGSISGNSVSYYAWTEWFPLSPITIQNFEIKAGDSILMAVCAWTPNHGVCGILNRTRNEVRFVGITPPANVTSAGATAEWIVEPMGSILPDFVSVTFTNCVASSKNQTFNLNGCTITEIKDDIDGSDMTATIVLSPASAEVQWLKSS